MKTLKVKSILFSLLAMMAVAVFMTSCGQEEIITDEITESNLTELSERLANNANFQASLEMHEKIGNDIIEFIKENNLDVTEDGTVITSFLSSYTVGEQEFAEYRTNLLNDIPELNSITEQAFENVVSSASNLLNQHEVASRNCWDVFRYCAHAAYLRFFHGYISRSTYLGQHADCVAEYHNCL